MPTACLAFIIKTAFSPQTLSFSNSYETAFSNSMRHINVTAKHKHFIKTKFQAFYHTDMDIRPPPNHIIVIDDLPKNAKNRVRFGVIEFYILGDWLLAYQEARVGHWEQCARDRARFARRILNMEPIISPIFNCRKFTPSSTSYTYPM